MDNDKILNLLRSTRHEDNLIGLHVLRGMHPGWTDFKFALRELTIDQVYTEIWRDQPVSRDLYRKYFDKQIWELHTRYYNEID